jgi:DNA-binding CsgD family transcriptional regulator
MTRRAQSKTSGKRVLAREREEKALALRKAGASYSQIAKQLGVTKNAAHKMVTRVLDRYAYKIADGVPAVRELEIQRLDMLLLGIWDRARRGDGSAIDRALKIMERRARLLGLDAPKEFKGEVGMSVADLARLAAEAEKGES